MSEDELKKYHHFKIKTSDGIKLDLIETKYYEELLDLYQKEKEKNKEFENIILKLKKQSRTQALCSIELTEKQDTIIDLMTDYIRNTEGYLKDQTEQEIYSLFEKGAIEIINKNKKEEQ